VSGAISGLFSGRFFVHAHRLMTPLLMRLGLRLVTIVAIAGPAIAAEPAVIAKARAYLGAESALKAVRSIHFVGSLTAANRSDPAKAETAAVEIFFQAPDQQRIQATSSKTVEVSALDGYDAWQRQQNVADPSKWQFKLLGTDQVKRLRASTWETLGFFRGIEEHGGRIEDQGPVVVEGMKCEKIAFIYAPNIIFYRYIELATGHLIYTETEAATVLREQGELMVGGIRFPSQSSLPPTITRERARW
jgi:hypothetical protein